MSEFPFHFLRPWWLLLLIPGALQILFFLRNQDPLLKWRGVVAADLLRHIVIAGSRKRWFNPVNVTAVVYLMGALVLAGPTWERRPSPFAQDESALVIALDVSQSMTAGDVQPSRLERAKLKIRDLLALRGGSRTGLIAYAGSAHSVIPLTNDPQIIINFLDAIVPEMMPRAGKRPDLVLPLARRMLLDSEAPGNLLLVSDGPGGIDSAALARQLGDAGQQLLILGIGAAQTEAQHGAVPIDEAGLKGLADDADGHYQRMTIDDRDVRILARRIDDFLVFADESMSPWVDGGYYLLFPMALLMLLFFRRGFTLHWGVALLLCGNPFHAPQAQAELRLIDLWLTADQQGRWYFERGDFHTAAQRFRDPMWKAVAHYLDEDFETAAALFDAIDGPEALFNLANAWAHSRRYLLAVQTYDRLLARAPDYPGAAGNRATVQAIIDDINRMSESQQGEPGAAEASRELGDEPQTADGAEQQTFGSKEAEQYSAEQVLGDPALHELWMRQIQTDPSRFLGIKFQMQLDRPRGTSG